MKNQLTIIALTIGLFLGNITLTLAQSDQNSTPSQGSSLTDQQSAAIDYLKPGKSRFLLRGYAHSGLEMTSEEASFVGGAFNPLLVFRQSDRLLFEGELEIELEDGETHLGLEYANMSYLLSDAITIRAGKFLLPFGTYVPNLHPAWINKFPTNPLGAGHDGILPSADIGIELRGASYLGNIKTNYSIYAVNGPQLNDGSVEVEEGGVLHYDIAPDNNKGKSFGGRLGFFPMSNSALEIGISGLYGKVGNKDGDYEDIAAFLYAFDMSYVQRLSSIRSVIDLKAQYAAADVDKAAFPEEDDPTELHSFDNSSSTWFAQLSIRPAFVSSKLVQNLELATRYSSIETPEGAPWEANQRQWEVGLNYWFDWRTLVKVSYRTVSGETGGHSEDEESGGEDSFFIHWAIGF